MNATATITRLSSAPAACPADLWHDAAWIEGSNGCSWQEALDGAAVSAGYVDHADACAAILSEWRGAIIGAQPRSDRGRGIVRDALRLLTANGDDLTAQGWGASDLFGMDPLGARHGLAFRLGGGLVDLVGHDVIRYRAGAVGRIEDFSRMNPAADHAPAFWEVSA